MARGCFTLPATGGSARDRWVWLGVGIAVALALPAVIPLAGPGVPDTYDWSHHVARTLELREAARGSFFPRWAQPFVAGLGFPFFVFYPPLAYYLAAALAATGLTLHDAFKLAMALIPLLASAAMYRCMVEVLDDVGAKGVLLHGPAFGAAAAFAYAPYLLTDIYRRGAFPEGLALATFPLLFVSFERLRRRPHLESVPLLSLCVAVVVLLHHTTAFIGIGLLSAYIVFSALTYSVVPSQGERRLQVYRVLSFSALAISLGLGITALSWLPVILERDYLPEMFEFLKSGSFSPEARLVDSWPPFQFSFIYDYGKIYHDVGTVYRAGFVQIIAAMSGLGLLASIGYRVMREGLATDDVNNVNAGEAQLLAPLAGFTLTIVALVLLLSPLAGFIWRSAPILSSFQFPWRIQSAMVLATSYLTGLGLYGVGRRWPRALPAALVVVIGWLALSSLLELPADTEMVPEPPVDVGSIHRYTSLAGWNPPRDLPLPELSSEDASALSRLNMIEQEPGLLNIELQAARPTTVVLHVLYFPGWKVHVDGNEVPAFAATPRGLLGFEVPEGVHTVQARFEDTPLRWESEVGSWLSGVVLLAIVGISLARRKPPLAAILGALILATVLASVCLTAKPNASPEFHSLDRPPANGVRLLGIGVERPRDGVVGLTLYWQALRRLDDLETFVALVDEQGNAVGNPMREPLEGAYPTSEWQIGEIVTDRVDIKQRSEVNPADVRVVVGLRPFDPTGGSTPVASFRVSLSAERPRACGARARLVVDNALALQGYELSSIVVAPGSDVSLDLNWLALRTIKGNVGVYTHLVDSYDQLRAQLDGPPGPPGYPAVLWAEGECVHERRRLHVPRNARPGRYTLRIGAYRYPDLQQLPVALDGTLSPGGGVELAQVFVVEDQTHPAIVNPRHSVQATFGEQLELVGFDLVPQEIRPGGSLTLTTYWRARREVPTDYTIFTHIVDSSGALRGQRDAQPADGGYPTSMWKPGEYVVDRRVLAVDKDAPPGDYHLIVGLYLWPKLERLPVTMNGLKAGDALKVGDIRVVATRAQDSGSNTGSYQ